MADNEPEVLVSVPVNPHIQGEWWVSKWSLEGDPNSDTIMQDFMESVAEKWGDTNFDLKEDDEGFLIYWWPANPMKRAFFGG